MYKPGKQIQVIVIDTVEGRHIQTICIQYTPPTQRSIFIFTEMHLPQWTKKSTSQHHLCSHARWTIEMWSEIQHRVSCRVRTFHLLQSGKAESDRNEIACANKCANSASACCQSWTQRQTSVLSCGKWPCRTWKSIFPSLTLWLALSLCMTTLEKIVGSDIGPHPCAEIALGTSRGWMTKLLLWKLSSRCLECKVGYTSPAVVRVQGRVLRRGVVFAT